MMVKMHDSDSGDSDDASKLSEKNVKRKTIS